MNKKTNVLFLILLLLLVAIIALTATYAIWYENPGESKNLRFGTIDENASVKYQIYVPINASGQKLEGTLDIVNREYTLVNPADIALIEGYALVGWDGGISVTRLEIPTTYSMKVNGAVITKSPLAVHVYDEFREYLFTQNSIIEEIEIPSNIISIDSGAFMFMSSLEQVKFTGSGNIVIGENAFALNPPTLAILYGSRTVVASGEQND